MCVSLLICIKHYIIPEVLKLILVHKGYFNRLVTVLVLYNAGPLDVSWAVNSDKVGAILESYLPAQVNNIFILIIIYSCYHFIQTGGSALLDVLTGVVSPAGRLPNTWPASLDQVFIIVSVLSVINY